MEAVTETNEEFMFTCDQCGETFPADPDTMRSLEASLFGPDENPTDVERFDAITELRSLSADELRDQGLDDEKREAMIRGETVNAGAICVCKPCQDKGCGCGCGDSNEKDEE